VSEADLAQRHRGREMAGVLAVVLVCVAGLLVVRWGVGAERARPEACAEILRRYADARLRQADPQPSPSALATQRAAATQRASRSTRFARCPRELPAEAAACALAAGDADQIERCLQ